MIPSSAKQAFSALFLLEPRKRVLLSTEISLIPRGLYARVIAQSRFPTVCSNEGLTLETSAKHHIPQATIIPYQPLLIKPIFSVLAHAEI